MSNRIAVFHDGVIQQLATPEDLYERPQNAFVAQFVGENNRLAGKVARVNGRTCVVEVEGGAVHALAVGVDRVGSRSVLSLRPERVLIDPTPASCPNRFDRPPARTIALTSTGLRRAPGIGQPPRAGATTDS